MTDNTEGAPFLLEADQGDTMSGAIGRDELGLLITAALAMPDVSLAAGLSCILCWCNNLALKGGSKSWYKV